MADEQENERGLVDIVRHFNDSNEGEDSGEAGHFRDVSDLDHQLYGSIDQAGDGFFYHTSSTIFTQ